MTITLGYFADTFGVDASELDDHGAFNISLISDLPLFIDPFLLFQSEKPDHVDAHDEIVKYLNFLVKKVNAGSIGNDQLNEWLLFKEVPNNWFGYAFLSNKGRGPRREFATGLIENLTRALEAGGQGIHLESVNLFTSKVGRDGISDFTTNIIKAWLCEYTQHFARKKMRAEHCRTLRVPRAVFDYENEVWADRSYYLPSLNGEFVLLTPSDILSKDETWINHDDLIKNFDLIVNARSDDSLRARVNTYLSKRLVRPRIGKLPPLPPTSAEKLQAVQAALNHFPELIANYLEWKELEGESAQASSQQKVAEIYSIFIGRVAEVASQLSLTGFLRHYAR